MTLPQETIEAIQKRSVQYAEHEWKPLSPDCSDWMTNARDYQAGATEWATSAQPLMTLLIEISESNCDYESTGYVKSEHSDECRACQAKAILAKYKEVGNER